MGSRIAGGPEPDRGSQEAPGSKASLAGDSGVGLSVCAMLGGAGSLYAIAQWGREHPQMAQSLGFSREQTPCAAALHHVFRRLDVAAFESALSRWAQEPMGEGEGEGEAAIAAIDGKALRGMHGAELPGVRLVAAYARQSGVVVGQQGGQGKERELEVVSRLLAELHLRERVVAGDALYAQRELSRRVLDLGGDYFWAVKDNQPGVKEAVSLLFEEPPWGERFGAASREGRQTGGNAAGCGP